MIHHKNQGFTLIEVGVVITIIGLIVTGIVVSSELLASAKIQRAVSEVRQYSAAAKTFKQKYKQLPGDFDLAYDLWGTDCVGYADPTDCRGNGNGFLEEQPEPAADYHLLVEIHQFWRHLMLEDLIKVNLLGVATPAAGTTCDDFTGYSHSPGCTSPEGPWGGSYFHVASTIDIATANSLRYGRRTDNYFMLSALDTSTASPHPSAATPAQARVIDSKMDDGLAGSGIVVATNSECTIGGVDPVENIDAEYDLSIEDRACGVGFFMMDY